MPPSRFTLSIDLSTLDHLGLNLYSNVPAVLSEAVANAWDADAENVAIAIDRAAKTITITDDGCGMSASEINEKYLRIGYRRREAGLARTPRFDRDVMGRKGIGKLSLFSIADRIQVESAKRDLKPDGKFGSVSERNGFVLDAAAIKSHIKDEDGRVDYQPPEVPTAELTVRRGTKIILSELKGNRASRDKDLRRRLARRFSVIGAKHHFAVRVDRTPITIADRAQFDSVQFMWYFGDQGKECAEVSKADKKLKLSGAIDGEDGYEVTGWIGTYDERKNIEDGANSIVVLSRGRLVQEDILRELPEAGLFTKYLSGELNADFIDLTELQDIATSDRQRIFEEDPRYQVLRDFAERVLRDIKAKWTQWRQDKAIDRAGEMSEGLRKWIAGLTPDQRGYAKKLFARIETIPIKDDADRRELYRQSVLAFETLSWRGELDKFVRLAEDGDAETLVRALGSLDDVERARYFDIAKGRLTVIEKLESVKETALERVLQEFIFDHLWLLDPSWERGSVDAKLEARVGTEWAKETAKLSREERDQRLDIKLRAAPGRHVIIELKKYSASPKFGDLIEQVQRYRNVVQRIVDQEYPDEEANIDSIVILGKLPTWWRGDAKNRAAFDSQAAKVITYSQLLLDAKKRYRDFLEVQDDLGRLHSLLRDLEKPLP